MTETQKANFKKSLTYFWSLYLICPIVFGLSISYAFYVIHQPSAYEKLDIFIASSSLKETSFCQMMEDAFADKGLKQASTTQCNPSDAVFPQKLSVVGYNRSDLFLLPVSAFKSMTPADILVPFSSTFITTYVVETSPDFYVSDGVDFAVKIKSAEEKSWLSDYINFVDEDYYLCLNATSKNIGDVGIYDNPEYDLALEAFTFLQGERK
jgi:hypothetical protein